MAPTPQPDPPAHAPPSDDDQDSPQADGQPPRKRRRRQPLSCTECKRRKIRCDRNQPCAPCVRRGDQAKCQWHAIEPATEKYVPHAEHAALRARVDALEALVHRLQVPSPPAVALSHAHPLPPTFSHSTIPFSPHSHPPAPPPFSSGPASFGSGSGSASFGTTSSSSGSGSTSTSTSASTSFANHASTSQATQHPDLLYQARRSHSPVSPSALVGRHVQDAGPGRSREERSSGRPKNRSAQARHSQGARLRARGGPWAVRLCRPLSTPYLRTLLLRTLLHLGILAGREMGVVGEKEETQERKGEASTARSASTLICTRRRPFPLLLRRGTSSSRYISPQRTRLRHTHTRKDTRRICSAAPVLAVVVAGGNCRCPGGRVPDRVRVDILSETLPWPKGARATPPLAKLPCCCGGLVPVGKEVSGSAVRASGRF